VSPTIRTERPGDEQAIAALISEAFATAAHSSGTEAQIVDALRADGALSVSLVAEQDARLVGHIAFSPVRIAGQDRGWFGLGPVAVLPGHQGQGIGARVIHAGFAEIRSRGARGCVLLGDPAYYRAFGFGADPRLVLPGVPPEYFQALRWSDDDAEGEVAYHGAFGV
jgi:predicted N-acetyltransferase YhbS